MLLVQQKSDAQKHRNRNFWKIPFVGFKTQRFQSSCYAYVQVIKWKCNFMVEQIRNFKRNKSCIPEVKKCSNWNERLTRCTEQQIAGSRRKNLNVKVTH